MNEPPAEEPEEGYKMTTMSKLEQFRQASDTFDRILREDGRDIVADAFQILFDNHPEIELLAWLKLGSDDSDHMYHYSVLVDKECVGKRYVNQLNKSLPEMFGKYHGKVWIEIDGGADGRHRLRSPYSKTWKQVEEPEEIFFSSCFRSGYDWTLVFLRRDRSFGVYEWSWRVDHDDMKRTEEKLLEIYQHERETIGGDSAG